MNTKLTLKLQHVNYEPAQEEVIIDGEVVVCLYGDIENVNKVIEQIKPGNYPPMYGSLESVC